RAERVRAGAGLGQSERADGAAVAQPRQKARADFVGAVAGDIVEAEVFVGHIAERNRRIPARQSLCDQPGGKEVAAGAAELGGRRAPKKPQRGGRGLRARRPPSLAVHALRQRPDPRLREAVAGREDLTLLLVQTKAARRK